MFVSFPTSLSKSNYKCSRVRIRKKEKKRGWTWGRGAGDHARIAWTVCHFSGSLSCESLFSGGVVNPVAITPSPLPPSSSVLPITSCLRNLRPASHCNSWVSPKSPLLSLSLFLPGTVLSLFQCFPVKLFGDLLLRWVIMLCSSEQLGRSRRDGGQLWVIQDA